MSIKIEIKSEFDSEIVLQVFLHKEDVLFAIGTSEDFEKEQEKMALINKQEAIKLAKFLLLNYSA